MPSSAKRGRSSGESSWACSIRCRSPLRLPEIPRLLERVQGLAIGAVADRVHRDRKSRCGAAPDDLGQLLAARDLDAAAVEHPRCLRAERAVHEHLQVPELQVGASEAGAQPGRDGVLELVVRDRLPDAQRQLAALLELLPEPQRAEPAVLVVHRGDPARVREPDSEPHRFDVLVVRHDHVPLLELPRRLFAEHAGRLAAGVALDDAALDVELAVCELERGRVEPDRVVVLGDHRGRHVRCDRVEILPRRLALRRPVAAAPPVAAQPAPRGRGAPSGCARAPRRVTRSRRASPRSAPSPRSGNARASR